MSDKRFIKVILYAMLVNFLYYLFNDMTRVESSMMFLLLALFVDRFIIAQEKPKGEPE